MFLLVIIGIIGISGGFIIGFSGDASPKYKASLLLIGINSIMWYLMIPTFLEMSEHSDTLIRLMEYFIYPGLLFLSAGIGAYIGKIISGK